MRHKAPTRGVSTAASAPQGSVRSDAFPILESIQDALITDLLTEPTRACRKALFVLCLICLAVTWGGLFPSEINIYGLKVSKIERTNLLYLLALVTAYYAISFAAYVYSDSKLRRVKLALGRLKAQEDVQRAAVVLKEWPEQADSTFFESPEFKAAAAISDQTKLVGEVLKAGRYKQLVDVYLPATAGVLSVVLVLREAGSLPSIEVVSAVVAFVTLIVGWIILQSQWFKAKWRWWKLKVGVGALARLLKYIERVGPLSRRGKIAQVFLTWVRNFAFGKDKKERPEDEDAA